MRNLISNFAAVIMVVAMLSACTDSSTLNMGMDEETLGLPKYCYITSENTIKVTDENHIVIAENVNHEWELEAQAPFLVEGKEPIAASGNLSATATPSVSFGYNYGIENTLTVTGLTMTYDYKGHVYNLICLTGVRVEGVLEGRVVSESPYAYDSDTTYKLVSDNGFTLAEATQEFMVRENAPEFVKTNWNATHVAYRRNANIANDVITVLCDNKATFADLYSDDNEYNQEDVDYIVENVFNFSTSEIKVDDLNTVVGKRFNFNNGTAVVEDVNVKATWQSAKVVGEVMHNEKDYASEIEPCVTTARTITFTSATAATIRFYNNDETDYAEVSVPVKVTEKEKPVTLKEIERTFVHKAFRKDAKVSGNSISAICDNTASFVKVYSNNHKDDAVNVAYTWTNKFNFNIPTVKKAAQGHSYNFNNGTAVVEGSNVTVTFASREVSSIVFENKDYKNEAPVCEVAVKSIRFGETTATITFEHNGETVTAEVPVSYEKEEVEATDLEGVIVAGWMTDSYVNQDAQREGTYLHILAKLADGTYIDHVRKEGANSFTKESLSATEGAAIIASNRAAAYVYNGSKYVVGTVSSTEAGGYNIITYYDINGNLAYILGKANQTIAGKFRYPIIATLENKGNGVWEMNGELFK